ncbi:MAG TPA: hypothetical protein VFU06_11335 [Longimicrobiales bacterium]|nr:hypothetical protein [Longimicrobiales bacterium]
MKRLLRRTMMIAFAIGAAGCAQSDADRFSGEVRQGLDEGAAAAAVWIEEARTTQPSDESVIAAGYLERLRLGLGSPFRLADYALADPRLAPPVRERVAWAILRKTLEQQSYQIDPRAFDRLSQPGGPGSGAAHLDLITDAISESPDPRTGELAVRLAYALASAEGSLTPGATKLAAQAAALVRDRTLAAEDVRQLLQASEASGVPAFELMRRWRQDRLFRVEQPQLAASAPDRERSAMTLAPRLAEALRKLPLRPQESHSHEHAQGSLLSDVAAQRLIAIGDSMETPPQAPVAIAARMYRRELLDQPWVSAAERAARTEFMQSAVDEEAFAAELSLLVSAGPHDIAPALAAVAGAVGLRSYAQEPVWFPGFGGPSARELAERYGITAITYSDSIPATWRPYLRRMIDLAFADLRLVMPALDVSGLRVHFGSSPENVPTLAMHDPSRRRLLLPPPTAAGTIAHEVAHDLDWQVALRRYRVRGDYASDRATRGRGDRLAMHLRDLASGLLEAPRPGEPAVHATRPAEVFARSIDWFVAVALAENGRSNGYLSSVQDDILTGYGTVRPPDVSGSAGDALMTILDEVAPVYPRTRQWFMRTYGTARALTPYDLVRHVLEADDNASGNALAPLSLETGSAGTVRVVAVAQARDDAFSAIDQWVCRAPAASHDRALEEARRTLVSEAASARGRGIALAQAEQIAGPRGKAWMMRAFYGAPWPPVELDEGTLELLTPIAESVLELSVVREELPKDVFRLARIQRDCADAPFAVVQ